MYILLPPTLSMPLLYLAYHLRPLTTSPYLLYLPPLLSLFHSRKNLNSAGDLLEKLGISSFELIPLADEFDFSGYRNAYDVFGGPGHASGQLGGFSFNPTGVGFQED